MRRDCCQCCPGAQPGPPGWPAARGDTARQGKDWRMQCRPLGGRACHSQRRFEPLLLRAALPLLGRLWRKRCSRSPHAPRSTTDEADEHNDDMLNQRGAHRESVNLLFLLLVGLVLTWRFVLGAGDASEDVGPAGLDGRAAVARISVPRLDTHVRVHDRTLGRWLGGYKEE